VSIELRDVQAGYVPDVPILNGISFEVADRSIVTILGPNGSGKSTLLKSVMGYLRPSQGSILVDGEPVDRVPVHQRAIGHGLAYVPQLENVFGSLTVRENLELGGARLPRRDRRARVEELLDAYPKLHERRRQRADSQSGGERQVLAIARALMTRPRYLLLDEPSAGLSPIALESLFEMLTELRARDGVTILIVEQNAAQSLAVSDLGLVLVLGRIALKAEAEGLLEDSRVSELYLGGGTGLATSTREATP
jgi:branched-chain amino acid transport system ATP-binding protein